MSREAYEARNAVELARARAGQFGLDANNRKRPGRPPKHRYDRKDYFVKFRVSAREMVRLRRWTRENGWELSQLIRALLEASGMLEGEGLDADELEALAKAIRSAR